MTEPVLATLMFTDVVDSTARAAELGDRRWRGLLYRYHELVREELGRFRGREIDSAGDGFLAVFDTPARAIRCACAISQSVRRFGLDVRTGLHTGECEPMGEKLGGIAVHVGARVLAEARPGEVVVSSTVRDIVAGSNIDFEDRGFHVLKGIPGEWRLFAVDQPALVGEPHRWVGAREFVGRTDERAALEGALAKAAEGCGGLVLVAGEAGVGKSRLVEDVVERSGVLVLRVEVGQQATAPYAPIVEAFRSYLREVPGGLADCGPLSSYLALILPELGEVPQNADRATLDEAILCAFLAIGRHGPAVVVLDDLHGADDTTLELLPRLVSALERSSVLLVASYRLDETSRGHPIRRLRTELRRGGRLREIVLEPLHAEETKTLTASVLGRAPSPALASFLHDRTQGIPFFVEELAAALSADGRLDDREDGVHVVGEGEVPIPETVRDAVLLRAAVLPPEARRALDIASVAGLRFDLALVEALVDGEGFDQAIESGFLTEGEGGQVAFRHALTRAALLQAIPPGRRRSLHRNVASLLEERGAPPEAVAEQWLAAGEGERARQAFLAAANAWCAVHGYRDASRATRRALELWPSEADGEERSRALERLGECAQLSGNFEDAARAWREAAERYAAAGETQSLALVQRRLAGLAELQCAWDEAYGLREAAAGGFTASGLTGEAAAERLAAAANLQAAGSLSPALDLITVAMREADEARRLDLKARLLALEGLVRARLGHIEAGLEAARAGLSLALAENLTEPAALAYEKLGMILENASDYRGAADAFTTAFDFCHDRGVTGMANVCLGCLAYVMRKTGEWERASDVCCDVLATPDAPRAAEIAARGQLGLIHVLRGEPKLGRPLLIEAFAQAQRAEYMIMRIDGAWGLARADELEHAYAVAADRCRLLLKMAQEGEDGHYPVAALRWAAGFFASQGSAANAGACTEVLARIASLTGNAEALGALAHALGEVAFLEGDTTRAAQQFVQALELLAELELPLERAETQLRAGEALLRAGERELGMGHLAAAHRAGRDLGAKPLAARAADALERAGESVDRHSTRTTTARRPA